MPNFAIWQAFFNQLGKIAAALPKGCAGARNWGMGLALRAVLA